MSWTQYLPYHTVYNLYKVETWLRVFTFWSHSTAVPTNRSGHKYNFILFDFFFGKNKKDLDAAGGRVEWIERHPVLLKVS